MTEQVLVPIADGTEEIEAVTIIDILRRAGADVTVASVDDIQVSASRGVKITADCLIADCAGQTYDLIVIPGGMPGAEHLRDSDALTELLSHHASQGRMYGAICAAPVIVLQHHGLLDGRRATCFPSFVPRLANRESVEQRVVVDGNCITSRGPGTAMEFAIKLVELLYTEEKAEEIAQRVLLA
ncbi:MAG: DJ-1/PfpI family protein [Anaerolineae bacterium]|nr:DJ-1/PfpI family protein [Anaerolineae bacterium]